MRGEAGGVGEEPQRVENAMSWAVNAPLEANIHASTQSSMRQWLR